MNNILSQYKRANMTGVLLASISMMVCILCGGIILLTDDARIYHLLFLLPFSFGLTSFFALIYIGNSLLKSRVSVILLGGYFIKMVITPVLFAQGGYESFLGTKMVTDGITWAILLMCAETTVVLGTAAYCVRRVNNEQSKEINFPQYNTKLFNLIIGLLFVFLIVAYIIVPAISEIYIFLPLADFSEIAEIQWDNETIVARGSIDRYVFSLFSFLWPVFRIIVPSLMISHFYKNLGTRTLSILLSCLCLLLPVILLGGDNIAPFIGVFVGIVVINKLYKKKARKYLTLIGLVTVVLLCVVVASKLELMTAWKGATGVSVVAQMFHNYFPGFDNLAATFEMSQEDKIVTLFYDFYYAIPFKETLFGLKGEYIQDVFYNYTRTGGQIVPFVGQLTYYIGPLSLIAMGWFVSLAYKMEQKSNKADNFWLFFIYMYISVYTAMALSFYSFSIYFRGLVEVVLPVFVIIKFVKKSKSRKIRIK